MKRILSAALLFALLGWGGVASATISAEGTGLGSADQTVDFESVALPFNQPVTDQFGSFGLTFTGAFGNPDPSPDYSHIGGNRIGNFQGGIGDSPLFLIDFATDLGQAAFSLITADGGTTLFQAWLDGVLVESASFATQTMDPVNFFTFSGIVFDRIQISVTGTSDRAFLLDNLQTVAAVAAPVPEPETWALLLAGLCAVGSAARRRRSARRSR